VIPAGADTDLGLWIFGWDIHALTHHPWSIFDANIYHPYRHTLAYAENLIGSAALSAPIVWLTGNLVLAVNAAALLSCVLCGLGTYVLARRLGIGPLGATVAGLIFGFAPPRFFRLGQPHLTAVQWLPFCLAFVHSYLKSGNKRHLHWACAFFALQAYTSGHAAVLTAVSILVLIVWCIALGEPIRPVARLRDLGAPGILLLALVVPLVLPYRAVQNEMGLQRSLRESFMFAPNPESFFASPTYVDRWLLSRLTDVPVLQRANAVLFPGYLTYLLAILGVLSIDWRPFRGPPASSSRWTRVAWLVEIAFAVTLVLAVAVTVSGSLRLRYGSVLLLSARQPLRIWLECFAMVALRLALRSRAPIDAIGRLRRLGLGLRSFTRALRNDPRAYYVVLALITFWLALGPGFGLYNRVYDWPGFSFIRVPSRFTIVTLLALAILAGFGFDRWSARLSRTARIRVATLLSLVLVAEFSAFPLGTVPYSHELPAIDKWLNTQPKPFVVAEAPVQERLQGPYMLHSMAHWQKTVHGYSGMRPALHSTLYAEMATFPDDRSLASLVGLGVTHIVVHTEFYDPGVWPLIETKLAGFSDRLTLEHVEGDGRVYALRLSAPTK